MTLSISFVFISFLTQGLVSAQDGKDDTKEPSISQVTITIEFDDKNNHTPIFEKGKILMKSIYN